MGTEQVTAAMPYRFYSPAATYASMVGCLDTTADITGSYPMLGTGLYGSSIFGGGGCMPFGAGPGMGPGMGMYGYGPGYEYGTMTRRQALGEMNKERAEQLESGVELSRQSQDAEFRARNHNDLVSEKAAVLQDLIKENNQDQISSAYENLKEAVREKLKHDSNSSTFEPTEHQVDTEAKKMYYLASANKRNITDDLHQYGDSPFTSGFKSVLGGIGWAFMDNKTATRNIAEIEGVKVPKSEKAKEIAGGIAAGIITLGAALLLHKGYKAWKKPPSIDLAKEATKALTPAEKLTKVEASIKALENHPRMAGIFSNNPDHKSVADILESHSYGSANLSKDEEALLKAYQQAQEAASNLRAGIFQDDLKKIMSS